MAYYKTSDAGVLAAWRVYREGCDRLKVSADEFAASYPGATALMRTDWHSGKSFYGLKFEPPMRQPLWTKPDPKAGFSQFPRQSLPPGFKGEERKVLKAELTKLQEDFKGRKPKDFSDMQPFLESIGLGGGALFFARYKHVITDDCLYINTSAKPSDVMIEILGSEFESAEKVS